MKQYVKQLLPSSIVRTIKMKRMEWQLNSIRLLPCDASRLGQTGRLELKQVFNIAENEAEWAEVSQKVSSLRLAQNAGGINPGDQRAIYSLIKFLHPRSVLEIGTHIGASTTHIALALQKLRMAEATFSPQLTTVDIRDVNDVTAQPWLAFGSTYSPQTMLKQLQCDDLVTFVTGDSIEYFKSCQQTFDFIFLDGDHSAPKVYQEVAAALTRLNEGGFILLHDYFPNLKPLWSNGALKGGPYLAIERFRREGANFRVLPLGQLPWPTKRGSSMTSLALLGQADDYERKS